MSDFGLQLKKLRKKNKITQKELAKKLGLAQTTIANYENNSRFPKQKTLLEIADYFEVTLDHLIAGNKKVASFKNNNTKNIISIITKDTRFKDNDLAKKYFIYLLNHQKKEAQDLILKQTNKKDDIFDIYHDIFKSVLYKIGELWAKGKIGIEQERYFSNSTLEIIISIKNKIKYIGQNGHTILGLTPYEEKHNIGLKMIMHIFQLSGWNSIYYGNNLPIKNILKTIYYHDPDVVAFSITAEENINSLIDTIDNIRQIYDQEKLTIIIGGYAARRLEERSENIEAEIINKDIKQIVKNTIALLED